MTYKHGDKVVCIEPKSSVGEKFDLPKETVFTVASSTEFGSVKLEGRDQTYTASRFRLAGVGEIATAERLTPTTDTSPLASQVGGGHYKDCAIQPVEFIHANGLPFIEGCVVKYVSRWRKKGGVQDLKKARHFLDMLIELEAASTAA